MVNRQENPKLLSIESMLPLYEKSRCIHSSMESANDVPVDIEQYLFDFSENIFNSGVESAPNYAALKQYLLCPCDVHIVNKTYNNYDLSKYIFIFSPFWIRSPSTWDKEGGKGLLEHLFVLYEVPSVLKKAWFQGDVKFIQWFLLYAQGGSLKKANKIFGWSIGSDKLWSKLYGVPTRLSLLSAVIYAEIDRLGGSNRIYNCIINDSSFAIDIINMDCENKPSLVFWYDTVRWLICNCGISETAMRRILAWARHKYTESREDKRRFSLGRKKFITVIIRASTYHQQINRYGYSCKQTVNRQSWKSHNWDWELKTSDEALWEMKELTDSYVLYMEGREMRHCVSSYAGRCLSGCSAIFSLGYNGVKKVTIEVNPLSKVLNQVKGFANKEPTSEQWLVVNRWLNEVVKNN